MSSSPNHILIVEDEKDLAELISYNLRKAGFFTTIANTGKQALDLIANRPPDLILLDLMLPEFSGTEIAGRVRSNPSTASIPIIMVTAKGEEVDQVVGLTVGADDYITKPFSMKVLVARARAVLRRAVKPEPAGNVLTLRSIALNLDTHEANEGGRAIHLTLTEFRILAALMRGEGKILSRAVLMGKAMGPGVTVTERTIDVHVTAIRKKLGACGGMIRTVRGVGYRATPEIGSDAEDSADQAASAT